MRSLSHALWLFLPALLLGGCPIYPSSCNTDEDCDFDYVCEQPSGRCVAYQHPSGPERCTSSADCAAGLVCDEYDRCVPPSAAGGEGGMTSSSGGGDSGAATNGSRDFR